MKTLRVMVITTVPQTLAAFFPRQLRSLADAGFDVHAVSSPGADLDAIGRIPGVTVHALPIERQPHPLRDCRSLFQIFQLIRRIRPQIVHSHTPKAGLLGMAAAKAAGVPVRLYTIHGLPLETRTGLWRRILEAAERASAALSTRSYAVSPSLRKVAIGLKLCPASKLSTLGAGSCAGVDLDRFNPVDRHIQRPLIRQSLSVPDHALLLSFVGRLSRDKGLGVLAQAWPEIARQLPEAHLLLAGDPDPTDPLPAVTFSDLCAHPRVHFTGAIAANRVPAHYAATDIFVLPTFREGLSQVSLEAGAMGVPIVATRVTGLDPVIDGVTGVLVPAGQSAPLADAIVALARNPSLRGQMSRAAQASIATNFSAQQVNQIWMDEYRQLVQESLPELSQFGELSPVPAPFENRST